ncbi:MAG: hypothetical protein AAF696_00325 [Bacteroidota bacterium]
MNNKLKTVSLIASIITVINFSLSISLSFEGLSFDLIPNIAGSFESKPLFFRIIIFLLLEVLISYVFVKLYLLIHEKSADASPLKLVLKTILLMCSAWTSLFNVKWLILSYFNNKAAWIVFLILAALIANAIWTYWYQFETKDEEEERTKPAQIFFLHALFLGLVFAILIADRSF